MYRWNEILNKSNNIPYIIAEIGLNHNGREDLAIKMIEAACKAGANAVKFQLFKTEFFIDKEASLPSSVEGSLFEFFKKFELPKESWFNLREIAEKFNVDFLCSVFDLESLKFYKEELKINLVKIASSDLTNYLLLKEIKQRNMEFILSTGASEEQEIQETIKRFGKPFGLLQCVSHYPAKEYEYNLSLLPYWKEKYNCLVGISDHCASDKVSIASIFFGCQIIEKHFTIDKSLPGPDQSFSITPKELKGLIEDLRIFRNTIGKPIKKVQPNEENVRLFGRRSLYYFRDLKKGHNITYNDLIALRPGGGIPPEEYETILGKILKRDIKKGKRIHQYDWEG
ncbi:MAG: N-acetylneuraminate synthase family protein [Leptonema sp. (in: bacteria)]